MHTDNRAEDPAATRGMAALRQPEIMRSEAADLVQTGLKFYYKQLRQDVHGSELAEVIGGETKVVVLCTWDPVVSHLLPGR